ncbi:MAG: PhzF family phenazine biosynthesis protein [Gemmatimonadetes bacterium]|nr:PhzF family phenazine biosynthesis protein [Gemmatimonadota bacterium]
MPTLWLIDAFTDAPFKGNPAGVCHLTGPAPEQWMQSLAAEMNQAETAFVQAEGSGFRLRWFTPAAEVDLCGHATLATAHFLWESGTLARALTARFHTRSGLLTATPGPAGTILLDFPSTPQRPAVAPPGLHEALGTSGGEIFSNQAAQPDFLIVLPDAAAVRRLEPDMARLRRVDARGVIVTAPGDQPGIDFVSRFFAPRFGVDEDPVTGSAHCSLSPFWAGRLGRTDLVGYQASRRGGLVGTRLLGDRVELAGHAVTVLRGAVNEPRG